jgi:hypothetical protein
MADIRQPTAMSANDPTKTWKANIDDPLSEVRRLDHLMMGPIDLPELISLEFEPVSKRQVVLPDDPGIRSLLAIEGLRLAVNGYAILLDDDLRGIGLRVVFASSYSYRTHR